MKKPSEFAALGFCLSFMTWQLMSCICGRFDAYALICAVPGVLLAWIGLVRNQTTQFWPRLGFGFVTVASTFLLLKVVVDVLWTGHEPLFKEPQWVINWIYWAEMRS